MDEAGEDEEETQQATQEEEEEDDFAELEVTLETEAHRVGLTEEDGTEDQAEDDKVDVDPLGSESEDSDGFEELGDVDDEAASRRCIIC